MLRRSPLVEARKKKASFRCSDVSVLTCLGSGLGLGVGVGVGVGVVLDVSVLTEAWKTRARKTPALPAGAAYSKVRGAPTLGGLGSGLGLGLGTGLGSGLRVGLGLGLRVRAKGVAHQAHGRVRLGVGVGRELDDHGVLDEGEVLRVLQPYVHAYKYVLEPVTMGGGGGVDGAVALWRGRCCLVHVEALALALALTLTLTFHPT